MNDDEQENFDFAQFLRGRVKERGFDLKKLSEVSGITTKHLESLVSGNFHNLPATPYFRGYLLRLGQILDFDAEAWWLKLKEAGLAKGLAAGDAPPKNRFVCARNAKFLWFGAAALFIILFLWFGFAKVSGRPEIKITNPAGNPATIGANQIEISGMVKNGSELYINGESVSLAKDGSWSKAALLSPGANSFEIRATKFLGGETKIIEQIIYEPGAASAVPTAPIGR